MSGSNLQIRITDDLKRRLDKMPSRAKSDFVRQAIREKLRREEEARLDKQWIEALKKNPQDNKYLDDWVRAQAWSNK